MKKLFSLISIVLALAAGASAQYATFDDSKVPELADRPAQFAPPGWKVEGTATGDLNGDGKADHAIKFVEDRPQKENEGFDSERVILIALADGAKFRRTAIAKRILQCTSCGGAFYGMISAPAGVTIEKGVLVIENEHGSRNVSRSNFKFRYDKASGRFVLIGYDFVDYDRLDGSGSDESTNYVTNRRVTKTTKGRRSSTKRSVIKPTTVYLEDADGDEIEGQALERLGLN
jgi:hypothetical protein